MPQSTHGHAAARPVAIVTGAGSGIGLATAIALAGEGFDLALVGRRAEPLRACAEAIPSAHPGASTFVRTADVGDADGAASVVADAVERFGRLDLLVNNAGLAPLVPLADTTAQTLRDSFAVNAIGPGALIVAAWHHLVACGKGCVVNISTIGTADPFPGFFAYAAAKASVNLFAKSVAIEGAAHGVRGFAIAPGAVETPMLRGLFGTEVIPQDKCLRPEDVARVVVDCVMGRRDQDNGATIFLPGPE